jgi:hypothetical protein
MLPHFEQQALDAHVDRSKSVYDPLNLPARKYELELLRCPSDSFFDRKYASSYAACHNDVEAPIDEDNAGAFVLNTMIGRDDITDGLGYTLFIGEKLPDVWELGWMSGTRSTLRNTGTPLNSFKLRQHRSGTLAAWPAPPSGFATPSNLTAGEEIDTMPGFGWVPADVPREPPPPRPAATPEPAAEAVPGLPSETDAPAPGPPPGIEAVAVTPPKRGALPPPNAAWVGGFGSPHQQIVNMALGDGSVRRVSEHINPKVLQQLGSRNDGQLPPDMSALIP